MRDSARQAVWEATRCTAKDSAAAARDGSLPVGRCVFEHYIRALKLMREIEVQKLSNTEAAVEGAFGKC